MFGWTAVLVPFRLLLAGIAAVLVHVLRLHPYLELYVKKAGLAYVAPEITVATFAKEGHVPDLTPEEAALVLARPIKANNLVALSMAERGVVEIVSRSPLQLRVVSRAGACPLYWDAAGTFAEIPRHGSDDVRQRELWDRHRRRGGSFGVPAPTQAVERSPRWGG